MRAAGLEPSKELNNASLDKKRKLSGLIERFMPIRLETTEEAEKLGKELQEDIVRIQQAAQSVTALLPERFRKKIPVEFG